MNWTKEYIALKFQYILRSARLYDCLLFWRSQFYIWFFFTLKPIFAKHLSERLFFLMLYSLDPPWFWQSHKKSYIWLQAHFLPYRIILFGKIFFTITEFTGVRVVILNFSITRVLTREWGLLITILLANQETEPTAHSCV